MKGTTMKRFILSLAVAAIPVFAHAQVGVSVNIGEPGFYGQINLGNLPPPPVVYANPVIVQAPPPGVVSPPLYLRVPPEHHQHWDRYCHQYNACNRHVYFVTDEWYSHTYVPHYVHEHPHEAEHGHEHEHEHEEHEHHEEH